MKPTEALNLVYSAARRAPISADEHDQVAMAAQLVMNELNSHEQTEAPKGDEVATPTDETDKSSDELPKPVEDEPETE